MRYACKCAAANVAAALQVRADLNVPLDKEQKITDDTRIRAAIPTLKYLLDNGARVLLTSHLVCALASAPQLALHSQDCACKGRSLVSYVSERPAKRKCRTCSVHQLRACSVQQLHDLVPQALTLFGPPFNRAAPRRAPRTNSG